ncbi:hypothetical protein E1B28_007455 [Marasmius oreades]|uniref:Uncharacterized protein n=1 Tax=Marasmius oreades TaxID=181124 RepID=A0A9P7UVT6_9AGAR|nr:uncharacterized protein E1B28_007455 [Marasmius oreades]KAG7093814.1 hypothetical protein E1B28_007455 [Marasmius oreades]
MAENEAPAMHGPRLDISKLQDKKNKKLSRKSTTIIARFPMTTSNDNNTGLLSPPSQSKEMQAEQEQEARQLISPPPEEELRFSRQPIASLLSLTNSKRKRSVQSTHNYSPQVTPNPKPRKQSKQTQAIISPTKSRLHYIESPHANNPDADFVASTRIRARLSDESTASNATRRGRRSATPIVIPSYEPPNEVFTPPREITLTPSPSKPKRAPRKSVRKALSVKIELPSDMDALLKEPMPPASPTDDPLLLSGPVEPDEALEKGTPMEVVAITPRRPTRGGEVEASLPPSSPPSPQSPLRDNNHDLPVSSSPIDGVDYFFPQEPSNSSMLTSDDDDDIDMDISLADAKGPIPTFVLPPRGKVDQSIAEWSDEENEDVGAEHLRKGGEEVGQGEGEYTGKWRMWKVRTKTDPPSSATKMRMDSWGRPVSPYPPELLQRSGSPSPGGRVGDADNTVHMVKEDAGKESEQERDASMAEAEGNEEEDRSMSIEPQVRGEDENAGAEEEEVRAMSIEPDLQDDSGTEDEREEEEVREMSFVEEGEPCGTTPDDALPSHSTSFAQPDVGSPQRTFPRLSLAGTPSRPRLPTTIPLLRDLSFLQKSPVRKTLEPFSATLTNTGRGRPPNGDGPHIDEDTHQEEEAAVTGQTEVLERENEGHDTQSYEDVEVDLPCGDESSDDEHDPGLVKITSSDPRAAARAAAILRQHDYDCFTKITAREKRRRHSSYSDAVHPLDSLKRTNRRRTVTAAGVTKSQPDKARRLSLGTVVGDKVYIPGSPVVTLGGLLDRAAKEVGSAEVIELGRNSTKAFETPLPSLRRRSRCEEDKLEWTREDWKALDACFTDERIALGEGNLDVDSMADVDAVDLDKVIDNFLELSDFEELNIDSGSSWSRESLRTRAEAIRKKQRGGKIAPPTPLGTSLRSQSRIWSPMGSGINSLPSFSTPSAPNRTHSNTCIPTWTPKLTPLPTRSALPAPIGPGAPFSTPRPALMAPRYGYLLEEAERVSRGKATVPLLEDLEVNEEVDEEIHESGEVDGSPEVSLESTDGCDSPSVREPQGLGGRMKGLIFSYLPTLTKDSNKRSKEASHPHVGLPLPPPEVLSKQRGPIATPARSAVPRGPAPKDLVSLNHQDLPPKTKVLERKEPKRLVDLRKVQPPPDPEARRCTGAGGLRRKGSVKDLVKNFEEMERSVSSLGVRGDPGFKGKGKEAVRPAWRP